MTPSAESIATVPLPGDARSSLIGTVESVLDAAIQAQRAGALDELVRTRPLLARWMLRRHAKLITGTQGLAADDVELPGQVALGLGWLVSQLRPDGQPGYQGVDESAWLQLSAWRPMLALASHLGWLRIPDFPRRYRRRDGESAMDNLCGIWNVGPSTIYRLLERARQALALLVLESPPAAARSLSLRAFVLDDLHVRGHLVDAAARAMWHGRQVQGSLLRGDAASALWHSWKGDAHELFIGILRQHAARLASVPETEALVLRVAPLLPSVRLQVELWLARAALARTRHAAEKEWHAYEQARQLAQSIQDRVLLGIVYSELGKFHEPRDADRAFACYQDSAGFLSELDPTSSDAKAFVQRAVTLTRWAWLLVLRNDERSAVILEQAQALRPRLPADNEVEGMLEQVWAEYWRRAGNAARALEHRYRALNIFERQGDLRSVLATKLNLVTMHGECGALDKALEFAQQIFEAAQQGSLEPALIVSTHLNLGLAHHLGADLDAAISQYEQALSASLAAGLKLHAFRSRYNLAEAHYTRFREQGQSEDERLGDAFVEAVLAAEGGESIRNVVDGARELKKQILGQAPAPQLDRLVSAEEAAHFDELARVRRQRLLLSVPGSATEHVRARLAIARAYLAISNEEREAALALAHQHDLQSQFAAEFDELQQTFNRELTREQQLAGVWKQSAADLVDDARRAPLIAHLVREGSINKSRYAELCGVSPATASKHLGLLAERGLLAQLGKGPSTRYQLPE